MLMLAFRRHSLWFNANVYLLRDQVKFMEDFDEKSVFWNNDQEVGHGGIGFLRLFFSIRDRRAGRRPYLAAKRSGGDAYG
jgi:hypothetical protein